LLALSGTQVPALAQSAQDRRGQEQHRLEGIWDVSVTVQSCATGAALFTGRAVLMFIDGGTLTEIADRSNRSAGLGTWRHLAGSSYTAREKFIDYTACWRLQRNRGNHAGNRTRQKRRRIHSDRYYSSIQLRRPVNQHRLRYLNRDALRIEGSEQECASKSPTAPASSCNWRGRLSASPAGARFRAVPASHLPTTAGRRQSEQPRPCPESVTDSEVRWPRVRAGSLSITCTRMTWSAMNNGDIGQI
jgi:hypothetical protein